MTDEFGATNSTTMYLNISNINDPPKIENYSANPKDNLGNHYINNLTAYVSVRFIYQINATDVDLLIDYQPTIDDFNENLTYISNDTWLNHFLNNKTGLINISANNMTVTPNNYTFTIIVTDNGIPTYTNTTIMSLEIRPNDPPQFNQTLNFTCFEYDSVTRPTSCYINISPYTSDPNEPIDYVANFSGSSNEFNITSEGIINFNPAQEQIGTHTFNITITDSRGATNTAPIYLSINNTNNKPNITLIESRAPPNALYYNRPVHNLIEIFYYDLDLNLTGTNETERNYSYEQLTFNWENNNKSYNLSGYISISPNITNQTSTVYLIINTTKLISGLTLAIGDYSINITVQDNYYNYTNGANTSQIDKYMYNFIIYNTTTPPKITFVYPYGNGITNFSWHNVTDQSPAITNINITENRSLYFNHSAIDDQAENLTYKWFYDNVKLNRTTTLNYNSTATLLENNKSINFSFGFFEVKTTETIKQHKLKLVVVDGFDASLNDTFTWNINVTDKNRRIIFNEPIPNITIEGSRNADNKDLWTAGLAYGFYDPDYDYDEDGVIELREGNYSITYNVSDRLCQGYATINVSEPYSYLIDSVTNITRIYGHGIKATGTTNGNCSINFTATDGEYTATSNNVQISVIVTSSESPETINTVQGSTSSTRTITETVTITIPEEVEKPIPIDIILPDMVTVYENNTIEIPLRITNTWNKTVYGVHLGYKINESLNCTVQFKRAHFFQIDPGQVMNTTMTVSNYRIGGIYEILVIANVTDPPYIDTAKIYLNSIEQTTTGSKVRTLIRFAQDLLQKHKECQEIEEVLNQAEEHSNKGELNKALELANSAINGCKYLISQEQQILQRPKMFRKIHIPLNSQTLSYLLITIIIALLTTVGILLLKKKN